MKKIPEHLKQYIVKQDYKKYTYIDQACWQFIMKISVNFFKKNAHRIYKEGLNKTGITLNKIPKIKSINKKLSSFGWNAVCVRGFIPPQAFMEFQSLRILPIASDMRSHKHLTYTPSPDIVHEAAGHAPIIANKDYAQYLINYGEIASKAIISSEDMGLYYAIRDLSDIKEKTDASKNKILKYEKQLKKAYNNISYISESSLLSRMNWWTVEYGLIGDINSPKIYGAGLLSSVGESENCMTKKVKKIPFSLDCLNFNYDITEQQPQLFVTPNYKTLSEELVKLSNKLSYKIGGLHGIKTAIQARTVCTIEIDNEIQLSGVVSNYIKNKDINFIKLNGPTQLCINNKEIKNHGTSYHKHGYSSPIGKIIKFGKSLNKLNTKELAILKIKKGLTTSLIFEGNIYVEGIITKIFKHKSQIKIITFKNCTVKHDNNLLFQPDWGLFDLICGLKITSVYGGPSDSQQYYKNSNIESLFTKKYNRSILNNITDKKLNNLFRELENIKTLSEYHYFYKKLKKKSINDWLLKYKLLEAVNCDRNINWINELYNEIKQLSLKDSDLSRAIQRGLLIFK